MFEKAVAPYPVSAHTYKEDVDVVKMYDVLYPKQSGKHDLVPLKQAVAADDEVWRL